MSCIIRLFAAVTATLLISTAMAATINVGPSGDYTTITEALQNAANGDEIVIAPGTYDEHVDLSAMSDVTVRGQNRDTTIIAIGAANDVNEGILLDGSTGIVIEDLTINMSADNGVDFRASIQAMNKSTFTARRVTMTGGGRSVSLFRGVDMTLQDCILSNVRRLEGLSAGTGSGIEIGSDEDWDATDAMPTTVHVENCQFINCERELFLNPYAVDIDPGTEEDLRPRSRFGDLTFIGCTFTGAHATLDIVNHMMTGQWAPGSEILFEGCHWSDWFGRLFSFDSFPTTDAPDRVIFRDCSFLGNTAASTNGSVLLLGYACPFVLENTVINAYAFESIYVQNQCRGLEVTHCTLSNRNDTVIGSRAVAVNPLVTIRNSLLFCPGGFTRPPVNSYGTVTNIAYNIDYSIVNSGNPADFESTVTVVRGGNYTHNVPDPNYIKFVAAANEDFANQEVDLHLMEDSPAIDTALGMGFDHDVEGLYRPQGPAPDMGAYEFDKGDTEPGPTPNAARHWVVF
ncbi:MAG: hypothetical protein BWZ08_01033 [candidate division BRC1 bacterium ADurb.BinA292]|nr:MAG: hypothetical protein BWZ08_01033 [candidate division BRC1 bacterium ADurb.BinA292]